MSEGQTEGSHLRSLKIMEETENCYVKIKFNKKGK